MTNGKMIVAYGSASERELQFIRNLMSHLKEATFKSRFGINRSQQAERAYKYSSLLARKLASFGI